MLTERLELRVPAEADRARFIEFFGDPEFMAFSGGVCDVARANARFDIMLENAVLPYCKQPIIVRKTGQMVGYSGVAWYDIEGERRLEYGYRLTPPARGQGYATEAGLAILDTARRSFEGTIYAMIDPTNEPSKRVAHKLGFVYWKQAVIDGYLDNLYRITLP